MKKSKLIELIIKIMLLVLVVMPITMQYQVKAATLSDIVAGGNTFLKKKEKGKEIFNADNEKSSIDQIYNIMLGIGIVVAIITGVILGIQLITSGAAGQAKVKEKLVPYIVGLFVVFGAFGIWRIGLNVGRTTLEAPPTYLIDTTDKAMLTVHTNSSSMDTEWLKLGWSDNKLGNYSTTDGPIYKDIGVYVEDAGLSELPVARAKFKFSFKNMYVDPAVSWGLLPGGKYIGTGYKGTLEYGIKEGTLKGQNGYNARYDASTGEVIVEYSDLNNIPYLTSDQAIVTFDIIIKDGFSVIADEGMFNSDDSALISTGLYDIILEDYKLYDKDGNDITNNVDFDNTQETFFINYKQDLHTFWEDTWYEGLGDLIFG